MKSFSRHRGIFAVCTFGILIVTTVLYVVFAPLSVASIVANCTDTQYRDSCYSQEIDRVFERNGLVAALQTIAGIYDADPSYFSACHSETHDLGVAAYKEFQTTGTVELSPKASYCGYGLYHGFLEELVVQTGDLDDARKFCSYAGTVVPKPEGYAEGACYHGIGHGVTDGTDPRLWGDVAALMEPSLKICRELAQTDMQLYRCSSGVFNATALYYRDPKYRLDPQDDPFSPCYALPLSATEISSCLDQMNTLAMYMSKNNFEKAMAYTQRIENAAERSFAVKGVAGIYYNNTRATKQTVSASRVEDVCNSTGADARSCVARIVGGIQEYGTPGREFEDMLAFCGDPSVSTSFAEICFGEALRTTQGFYGEQKKGSMCPQVPLAYRGDFCDFKRQSGI